MGKLLDEAIVYAVGLHTGQIRKLTGTPFILHPLETAAIAATLTGEEAVLAAAVLHDTVEDCRADPAELKARFGDRVAELVAAETEEKYRDRPAADTWRQRKEESFAELRSSDDPAVRILWLSDKLSNLRSFARGLRQEGDALWQHFHQTDPAEHAWYYRTVAELTADLCESDAHIEYTKLLHDIFGD